MNAASTVVIGGMTYGYSDSGSLLWVNVQGEEEPIAVAKPEAVPDIPPEVWHTRAFDSDRAHEALMALCRGS